MFLSKSHSGIYYIWYTDENGKRQKLSTRCRLKSDAVKALSNFRDLKRQHRSSITLQKFCDDFLAYARQTYAYRTFDIHRRALTLLQAIAGNIRLARLNARHIDQYKVSRGKEVLPVSVNIELRALRAAFNTAIRWKLLDENPTKGCSALSVAEVSPIFFTKESFQALLSSITDGWLKEVIVFAVVTGLRRGEVLNLRWSQVDLNRKLVLVQSTPTFKTKQGKRRVVPLNEIAWYILQGRLGKEPTDFVFTYRESKIREDHLTRRFKRAVRNARLPDVRLHFHSLRHTFASWLVQDGASLYEVQKLLGHSNSRITEVYSHLLPNHMHETVNRIKVSLN